MVKLPAEPVEILKNTARFIYITGCDGTGKTTQTCLLFEKLQAAGLKVRRVWLRFPFFFSLPLLAYARWRGLSWYEQSGDVRHGYWDFSRSAFLQNILPWVLLLDASIAGFTQIYLPLWSGKTVICERFVLDMLVDLGLAFGRIDLYRQLPGKLYLKLLPYHARIFILDLDADTIRDRRSDLCTDKFLEGRLEAYRQLSRDLALTVFSSIVPANTLNERIVSAVIL
jgi:thymidylate kinase